MNDNSLYAIFKSTKEQEYIKFKNLVFETISGAKKMFINYSVADNSYFEDIYLRLVFEVGMGLFIGFSPKEIADGLNLYGEPYLFDEEFVKTIMDINKAAIQLAKDFCNDALYNKNGEPF